jgi:hypothetical protein
VLAGQFWLLNALAFLFVESRTAHPILPLSLLGRRRVWTMFLVTTLVVGGPSSTLIATVAVATGTIVRRVDSRRLLGAGAVLTAAGLVLLAECTPRSAGLGPARQFSCRHECGSDGLPDYVTRNFECI